MSGDKDDPDADKAGSDDDADVSDAEVADDDGPAKAAAPGAKKTWKERLEDHLKEYGGIALVVYLTIWIAVWAGFAIAITAGLDIDVEGGGRWGVIGAAWLPTKLTQPLRIAATFVITPIVAGVWHRIRGGKKSESAAAVSKDAD